MIKCGNGSVIGCLYSVKVTAGPQRGTTVALGVIKFCCAKSRIMEIYCLTCSTMSLASFPTAKLQSYSSIRILISPGARWFSALGRSPRFYKAPSECQEALWQPVTGNSCSWFGLSVQTTACGWVSARVHNGWWAVLYNVTVEKRGGLVCIISWCLFFFPWVNIIYDSIRSCPQRSWWNYDNVDVIPLNILHSKALLVSVYWKKSVISYY